MVQPRPFPLPSHPAHFRLPANGRSGSGPTPPPRTAPGSRRRVTSRPGLRTRRPRARLPLAAGLAPQRPVRRLRPRGGGCRPTVPVVGARALTHGGGAGGCLRAVGPVERLPCVSVERPRAHGSRRRRAAEPARPWRRALNRRRTRCFTSSPAGECPGLTPRPRLSSSAPPSRCPLCAG